MVTIQTQNLDVNQLNFLCKLFSQCYVKQNDSLCSSCFDELRDNCSDLAQCSDIAQCSDSNLTDITDMCKELPPTARNYEDLSMSCIYYDKQS